MFWAYGGFCCMMDQCFLTTAYIKLLKFGREVVIPFSTISNWFLFNSSSNVGKETILHEVPATKILPVSCSLSWSWNAWEMSLWVSKFPSPMVQMRAIPSGLKC